MRGWASMIRASTPCGPQHELLPFKHGLARVPALITDADLTVFCGVKRKSCLAVGLFVVGAVIVAVLVVVVVSG